MSVLTNDIETIFNALSQVIPQFITAVIFIIGASVAMFVESWQLSLVVVTILPIALFLIIFITSRAYKYFRNQQIKLGEVNGIVQENVTGLKVVKLYNQEQAVIEKFGRSNQELENQVTAPAFSGMMMPIIRLLDNILYEFDYHGGRRSAYRLRGDNGRDNPGDNQFLADVYTPISNVAQIYNLLQAAIAGGYRVFKLIDEES